MGKAKDLTGQEFERLTVLYKTEKRISGNICWVCQCSCGNITSPIRGSSLTNKTTKSCGCLMLEVAQSTGNKNKKEPGVAFLNHMYKHCERLAKRRKIEFGLSKEEYHVLIIGNCHYCGIEPQEPTGSYKKWSYSLFPINGIDRIDSTKIYTRDNCVSCCKWCNQAKSTMTQDQFRVWLYRAYHYQLTVLEG